jgi:hypothetical protein
VALAAAVFAVAVQVGNPSQTPSTTALVIHITHDPGAEAALLARAMEETCGRAAARCRVAPMGEATTLLHVSAQTGRAGVIVLPPADTYD